MVAVMLTIPAAVSETKASVTIHSPAGPCGASGVASSSGAEKSAPSTMALLMPILSISRLATRLPRTPPMTLRP